MMDDYVRVFQNGSNVSKDQLDLSGLWGRITRGTKDEDFVQLTLHPAKRIAWVSNKETLARYLTMSHLDILLYAGFTRKWIARQFELGHKFKLIVFSSITNEAKLATWQNLFDSVSDYFPEINKNIWLKYGDDLMNKSLVEIDPEGTIVKNYYLGRQSDGYMTVDRFVKLGDQAKLLDARAFLYHEIGANELFKGDGRAVTHQGVTTDFEYLIRNRKLSEYEKYVLLDLNPNLLDSV